MRIAVVGGIGSGKSEFVKVAREMGVRCVSADEINADLMQNPDYIAKIASAFPTAVKDGKINKATLSAIVFSDSEMRGKLNAIAHPQILARITAISENVLIVELPLLIESGAADLFDNIVLISAPLEQRVQRLVRDRGMSEESAQAVIKAQVNEEELRQLATQVIINDGSIERLRKSAAELIGQLCNINKG